MLIKQRQGKSFSAQAKSQGCTSREKERHAAQVKKLMVGFLSTGMEFGELSTN